MRCTRTFLFLLPVTMLLHVHVHPEPASSDKRFISIDCGLTSGSSYTDQPTEITYVSDDAYIHTGENHNIYPEYQGYEKFRSGLNLRSFPSGGRNCYSLSPAMSGRKYLLRGTFMHGNYDGKNLNLISKPLAFDIYVGIDFWARIIISNASMTYVSEVIVVAVVNSISVCLIDIGNGAPFISSLEMRPIKTELYPAAMTNQSIALQDRQSMGASGLLRYPDDPYDRLWWPSQDVSGWIKLSTTGVIRRMTNDQSEVPDRVLQTSVTSPATSVPLNFSWSIPTGWPATTPVPAYYIRMHLTDFQQKQLRQFHLYFDDYLWDPYNGPVRPPYLLAACLCTTSPTTFATGFYNLSLVATNTSELPPMLNAFEVYYVVPHLDTATVPEDVDAMMAIKTEYRVKKNWMGDPCLPEKYIWIGLTCQSDGVTSRVISLDLSHSDLKGAISDQFSLMKSLQYLNLSYNGLNGSVPDSLVNLSSLLVLDLSGNYLDSIPDALCTKHSLTLRYDTTNGDPCNGKSPKKKNTAVLVIAIVVPVVTVLPLVSILLVSYFYRKQAPSVLLGCADVPDPRNQEDCKGHIHISDSREFTYKELVEMTNNFSACIGEGGFGPVFHGKLKDGTQVAVKTRSPTSAIGRGMAEFLAEVESLTTVHHRYLVLLVGYCTNKDHLALIYEYMPNGSLYDHVRGRNAIVQTLRWRDRARIALEAAQGLDYLHTGCVLPIIHRDMKSHNILLGHDMVAKISDFGLSKTYPNVAQSHISVTAAGTLGYIDPEYYRSGRVTMSSDVFSFGVVLLEIVTGEPPILPTTMHIVQRVKEKVTVGDIEAIVDPRLRHEYDSSSVWKVVDIALLCTREACSERPTTSTVVAQLKDALALEEARAAESTSDISQVVSNAELSISSLASGR